MYLFIYFTQASLCCLAPPIALFLAKHPLVDKYNLSSLRSLLNGAAAVSPSVVETVLKRLNNPQLQFHIGMT